MSDSDRLPRRRTAAEIELVNGSRLAVMLFVSPQGRVLDMLNDGRGFLPVETDEGQLILLRKDAILRVSPAAGSKDGFDANNGAARQESPPPPPPPPSDPYELLGIPRDAPTDAIREAYRQRCRENHPDRLQALGLPKEFVDLATQRMAAINAAYDRLRELRQSH